MLLTRRRNPFEQPCTAFAVTATVQTPGGALKKDCERLLLSTEVTGFSPLPAGGLMVKWAERQPPPSVPKLNLSCRVKPGTVAQYVLVTPGWSWPLTPWKLPS